MLIDEMDEAQLKALLEQTEREYDDFELGRSASSVNESNGAGGSGVSFRRYNPVYARGRINELRRAIGLPERVFGETPRYPIVGRTH